MIFTDIFKLEDEVVNSMGLYTLWWVLNLANVVVLLTDLNMGDTRDFNIIVSILSTLYVCCMNMNTIYGNGLPSSMLLIVGPIHQYSFWMLLCYFGPGNVLDDSPIGKMNITYCVVVGLFTLDMIVKSWYLTIFPDSYRKYVKDTCETPETTEISL